MSVGCGILKMVGPKKQAFFPRIDMLKGSRCTVACIIVRRLLISVHKWQSSGMADTHEYWSQHDAHLVYLPIFHGLNLIIVSK